MGPDHPDLPHRCDQIPVCRGRTDRRFADAGRHTTTCNWRPGAEGVACVCLARRRSRKSAIGRRQRRRRRRCRWRAGRPDPVGKSIRGATGTAGIDKQCCIRIRGASSRMRLAPWAAPGRHRLSIIASDLRRRDDRSRTACLQCGLRTWPAVARYRPTGTFIRLIRPGCAACRRSLAPVLLPGYAILSCSSPSPPRASACRSARSRTGSAGDLDPLAARAGAYFSQ